MHKIDEILDQVKAIKGRVFKIEEEIETEKSCKNICAIVITVIAVIGILAAIGYAIYRFLGPSYFEDFEDDYEDDFDDDFFEDDDDDTVEVPAKKEEE